MADLSTIGILCWIIFTLQIIGIASWELPSSPKTKSNISDLLDLRVFQEDCWTNGACLESVMTNQIFAESTFACEDLCRQSPDCVWFTHYLDKGLCVLLSECIQLKPIPETISGQSKCGGVDQCKIVGRCVGKLIDVSYTETPQSCSSICQSILGCLWYTHDSSTKGCYSLKDCIPVSDCPTCISGEVNCPYEQGDLRLITGGGLPLETSAYLENSSFEAIDISSMIDGQYEGFSGNITNITSDCLIPPFPNRMWGAVSILGLASAEYKVPIVCGGISEDTSSPTSNCYALYKNDNILVNSTNRLLYNETNEWVETTPMSEERLHAGSVQILEAGMTTDYNWWVSGGLDKYENPLKSSELRWLNGTWTPGPVLPSKVYGHCVTQIQRQKSVLIGGYPSHDNYIYDWITKEWSTFPQLQVGRYYQGCGTIRNTNLDSNFPNDLIVVGGLSTTEDTSDVLVSAEIYRSEGAAWVDGPTFPTPIYGTTVVQYNSDTIIVVGGAMEYAGNPSSAIYSFSRSTQSYFVYLGETIQSRFTHVSILVPKNFVYCRGDVSLMGPDEEATLFDGDEFELLDFLEIGETN